jgi:hypothetical protein
MKKLLLTISLIFSIVSFAGTVDKTYSFKNISISGYNISGQQFHIANFENTLLTGKAGEPALPYYAVKLLLPPGMAAESIEFIGTDEVIVPGFFNIYPQQTSRPLSDSSKSAFRINKNIYNTDAAYPEKSTGTLTTEYLNGYAIALSTFTPVKYNPVTGVLSYYSKVTIKLTIKSSAASDNALQNLSSSKQIKSRILKFSQNPAVLKQYPAVNPKSGNYQLLIITPSQYDNSFQDLTESYLGRGIKTQIATTEYIYANISGQDNQEKIRNYIIGEYQNHSVEYVLLGGDVEYIPYRGFYCLVQSSSVYTDDDIPADLYYSALDGTWNDDGDGWWGEPGEDDLLPDIAVARFSFSNSTELSNMIHKTIFYQNSPVLGELRDPLLVGEDLWSNPQTWGADYMNLLIGNRSDNGYTTNGIPTDHNIDSLYEKNTSWDKYDLMAEINSGKQFVHHVGHANTNYVAHMYNSDITDANFYGANGVDHNYTLLQTHGCICGAFDNSDCILEKMVSIQNFAVAVIGNSRYGWFNEGQTEGPAEHLHREMIDALYNEKMNHIGAAFVECKIETAPWVTAAGQWEDGALRWNFYDINILGDPVLSVWTDEPINEDVTYEDSIFIGTTSTIVTVSENSSPLENFTCAILKDGLLFGTANTDNTGNALITFDSVFSEEGTAQLIVSGYNCLPDTFEIDIVPDIHFTIDTKVFLEGAYNGTDMNVGSNIPENQPFDQSPWDYSGTESTTSIPSNVVDWVLIELRDTTQVELASGATKTARQAGFLLTDGSIVSIDGTSLPQFDVAIANNLFIVICHRNHLDVISATSPVKSGGIYTYSFKTSASQAFGTDSQKMLDTNLFGLYSGDSNADGEINQDDKTSDWEQNAGKSGYFPSDFNLDGQSDNPDKNEILIMNYGKVSGVPE